MWGVAVMWQSDAAGGRVGKLASRSTTCESKVNPLARLVLLGVALLVVAPVQGGAPGSGAAQEASVMRRTASEHWHEWRRTRTQLPLAAWSYFHRYPGTVEEFQTYADAGLNLVAPAIAQFDRAAAAGLDVALGAFEPLHEEGAMLGDRLAFPTPEEGRVVAYILKDEPLVEDYPALGQAVARIYKDDRRGAIPIIDFRPNWAVPFERWGFSYETYLQRFLDEVHPSVLLNCHYPIKRDGSTRDSFYANIELFRDQALAYDIGLMGFVLVTPHSFTGNSEIDYRTPSASDLAWMAYSHLAYGAQGLWYYNWRIEDDRFGDGLVEGASGDPTATHGLVARLNEQIRQIGPELMELKSTGVYHTGASVPEGTRRLHVGMVEGLQAWEGDDFLLGEFSVAHGVGHAGGYSAAMNPLPAGDDEPTVANWMIVNKRHAADTAPADLRAMARFRLDPGTAIEVVGETDDAPDCLAKEGEDWVLELDGGQGVLLRLHRQI